MLPYRRDSVELAQWLASADALVHAGNRETFGLEDGIVRTGVARLLEPHVVGIRPVGGPVHLQPERQGLGVLLAGPDLHHHRPRLVGDPQNVLGSHGERVDLLPG